MATDRTPIVKRSRRLGVVLGKEKYARRRTYPPGIHGPKQARSRARMSSYGEQLQEKQKAKALYGVLERQLHRHFERAARQKGNTAIVFVQELERRLDNVIFRLGFAKTRRQARQVVSHGFIFINGSLVNIPSYRVQINDTVTVKETKKEKGIAKQMAELVKQNKTPAWLTLDEATLTGKMIGLPEGAELDAIFDPTLIVEFYSR